MGAQMQMPAGFLYPATFEWLVQHIASAMGGSKAAVDQVRALGTAAGRATITRVERFPSLGAYVVDVRRTDGTVVSIPMKVGKDGITDETIARIMLVGG